jgi:hypothetical protein
VDSREPGSAVLVRRHEELTATAAESRQTGGARPPGASAHALEHRSVVLHRCAP